MCVINCTVINSCYVCRAPCKDSIVTTKVRAMHRTQQTTVKPALATTCITRPPPYNSQCLWSRPIAYSTAHEQLNTLVRESRESLASSVVGSRETNWLHAKTLGYTRENTGLHSREHWATLARTLGYTRENTGLHSREHWATLARTLGYTREATWLHSRGHLAS